jgi:NAD(P)-dependent dehydrogenase (short-subunit alcohol dehydrogenase family)
VSWTTEQIPDLTGAWVLVTGASSGLGQQVALELARHRASVVLAGRDETRLAASVAGIRQALPEADLRTLRLDLADLAQVRRAADEVLESYERIDVLFANAGVMATPELRTADGFELQIGTNHLGHFAFCGLVLPALLATPHGARVVVTSSFGHRTARGIDLRSLTPGGDPRPYRRWRSYSESKLANLLFMLELQRRSMAGDLSLTSVAAHPGYAATNLQQTGPAMGGATVASRAMTVLNRVVAQSTARGARPLLMAGTQPGLPGGSYVGPGGPFEQWGRPRLVGMSVAASDPVLAGRLWEASEQATGVRYP